MLRMATNVLKSNPKSSEAPKAGQSCPIVLAQCGNPSKPYEVRDKNINYYSMFSFSKDLQVRKLLRHIKMNDESSYL